MEKINQVLPNFKEARKRTKEDTIFSRESFELPEHLQVLGKNKKFFIRTYGCQANVRDSETIAGILESMSYTQTEDEKEADVLIFNTCAIRKNAEDKVFGEIGMLKKLKRNNPEVIFAVSGCMSQEEGVVQTLLKKYDQVDLIFGTHNIHRLPVLLYNAIMSKETTVEVYSSEGEVVENLPVTRFQDHKAWVNIMYGCDKFCTYCIVPYTRGKQRSRLMSDIVREVEKLVEEGFKEICLLGQNVNAYGKDLKMEDGFATLLEEVAKTGIERIRFSTSHPRDFSEEMVHVMHKYPNIMPALHLPVQSGNNEILKLMGRGYTVEHYKKLVDALKAEIPGITFTTDIIVGFPNETEEQFQDTMKLVDYCQYDSAFTFVYSPRENTPAAKMEDNISEEEKFDRLHRLNEKIGYYSNVNNQKYKDKVLKVLCDGLSKNNKNVFSGYSEENKLVNFTGENIHIGDVVKVKITEVKSYSLNGEKVE